MTDKEKRELKDGVVSIFKRFNILDHTSTIGNLRDDILRYIDSLQEEHVSEDLEEASVEWFNSVKYKSDLSGTPINAFKAGAQWQEKQDQSIIELAEDHAMFAGMEKMKEQMMAKAVEAKVTARWPLHSSPLYYSYEIYVPYAQHLSEGDNVKILIIKKEDN